MTIFLALLLGKFLKDERSPFCREIWLNKLNQIFISNLALLRYTQ
ncbi:MULTISPECIES: hypothetical protein [unclassified Okeania]|nr:MULTISPECIES: hypothetical protein [unclassified Okeania]